MTKEEQDLRAAANNLILVLITNEQFKQGLENFDAMLSMTDYEKRIFESSSSMSAYSAAKDDLHRAVEQFKATYGSSAISAAYEAFKKALGQPQFCAEAGIQGELTKSEAATLFNKVFQELSANTAAFPEEADGYAIFVEMIRQALRPSNTCEQISDLCPYCDGTPARISKAEFFGDTVDDIDGYVWACECGAYAQIGPDGQIVGSIADRSLHNSRRKVKAILFELGRVAGITVFEGCRWIAGITGRRILTMQDVEFLNEADCETVLSEYESFRKRLDTLKVSYPQSHSELMDFLSEGGRLTAVNAYGYRSGRLLIPIKVAELAVRVRFRKTVQDIMLPKELDYQFDGSQFSICHPTGKREKFRLFAKEQRLALYKEEKESE